MRFLIKSIITGLIILFICLYIGLSFFGKALAGHIASQTLKTRVTVLKAVFIPTKLALRLYEISIPDKKLLFSKGTVYLLPLKFSFQGLKAGENLSLPNKNFFLHIKNSRFFSNLWEVKLVLKNINLIKISSNLSAYFSFTKKQLDIFYLWISSGQLDIKISGKYSTRKTCNFYTLIRFHNIDFNKPIGLNKKLFGIHIKEIVDFIKSNNNNIDLDFNYKGPSNELNDISHYQPGPKSIYLIRKLIS